DHRALHAFPPRRSSDLRLALAAPRGSAKSTVASLILTLHDIVYEREPYILLISATKRQAQQRLAAIRKELTHNQDLKRVFALPRSEEHTSELQSRENLV